MEGIQSFPKLDLRIPKPYSLSGDADRPVHARRESPVEHAWKVFSCTACYRSIVESPIGVSATSLTGIRGQAIASGPYERSGNRSI